MLRRTLLSAMTVVGVLVATTALQTPVVEAEEDAAAPPFSDGAWVGSMSASGSVLGTFPDASAVMTTSMSGSTSFFVQDDAILGGVWDLQGASDGVLNTDLGPGTVSNTYFGSGPVEGDAARLVLGGGLDTIWITEVAGQSTVEPDPIRVGPFEVEVFWSDCDRVLARWDTAFDAAVEAAGEWDSMVGGVLEATYTGEQEDNPVEDAVRELLDDAAALLAEVADGSFHGDDGELVVGPELGVRIDQLLYRAIVLEEDELAGLEPDGCELAAPPAAYSNLLTGMIQDLVRLELEAGNVAPNYLDAFAELLVAFGGVGAGAPDAARAAQLEELFAREVSAALDDRVVTDVVAADGSGCSPTAPCLPDDPDVLYLLRAAQLLGLTVTIAGNEFDGSDIDGWIAWLDDDGEVQP